MTTPPPGAASGKLSAERLAQIRRDWPWLWTSEPDGSSAHNLLREYVRSHDALTVTITTLEREAAEARENALLHAKVLVARVSCTMANVQSPYEKGWRAGCEQVAGVIDDSIRALKGAKPNV
jgi:hypothetical protein